jgi:hypothetical protein
MTESAFRPARSMMAQMEDLEEQLDAKVHACNSALEHVEFLQGQYHDALDALCRAHEERFAWKLLSCATGVALILAVVSC